MKTANKAPQEIYLNIGCGDKKLAGFVNLDLLPGADVQVDLRDGLPFARNSVAAIFSEHFIEHITQAEGVAFFRECRRVLKPGGVLRVATPDLDALVQEYQCEQWLNPEWAEFGYNYLDNRCEMLNLALREWGHCWVYNEDELRRLAEVAGLPGGTRCEIGRSEYEVLRNLEYRAGSRLILEFVKKWPAPSQNPLVSICIPAFNPRFFESALESACKQSYANIEIIICDDSCGEEIEAIVSAHRDADSRIRYVKNEKNLGPYDNFLKCFELAQGKYIKYLNDDDLLDSTCVERMAACLEEYPEATLVTSRRQTIDEQGMPVEDRIYGRFLVPQDSLVEGISLANTLLARRLNIVGEPSTVMFRRADLTGTRPDILSFGGRRNIGNGDVTMWVNLLSKGDAIYLTDTLSFFRKHPDQEQNRPGYHERGLKAWEQLCFDARRMGFLGPRAPQKLQVQPLVTDADSLYQQAQQCLREQQNQQAMQLLQLLVEKNPHHALGLNDLGSLYFQAGEKNLALMCFERSTRAEPRNLVAQKNLADLYLDMECFEEAVARYRRILEMSPEDAEALLIMAQLSQEAGRLQEALGYYKRLQEVDPQKEAVNRIVERLTFSLSGENLPKTPAANGHAAAFPANGVNQNQAKEEADPMKTKKKSEKEKPAKEQETTPVKVSIVIPVFNKVEFTRRCLDYLYRYTQPANGTGAAAIPFEVIVVDNASTDGTADFLREAAAAHDNLHIITNATNKGFSGACNQGARAARGEYIHFLNNDTEAQPDWLAPLVEILDQDSSVGAVGSKLLFPDGTIQHVGVVVMEDHRHNDPVAPRHIYYRQPGNRPQVNQLMTYKVLTAASLLMRKTVFEEAGGFDEGYWNGYEDVDLCFKVFQAGWKLVYQPRSVMVHYEKQSGLERFVKVNDNIKRLHRLWTGKIEPDVIVSADGKMDRTEHCAMGPYTPRGQEAQPQQAAEVSEAALSSPAEPAVSIIILTFNQLRYTKECLESVEKYSQGIAHEIIVVDNHSTDGTVEFLKKWAKGKNNRHIILNEENKGYAGGNNQGIARACGKYLLLLNNDVVVSAGWLEGLLDCLTWKEEVGLVGPRTNFISGPQVDLEVTYKTVPEFHQHAATVRADNHGRFTETFRLVGFCLMFKREVMEKVGVLDERFGRGNFEDDDFCLRAVQAGYRMYIAQEVFIHHYGNRSFDGNNINYKESVDGNRLIFVEKWKDLEKGHPLWLYHLLGIARLHEERGDAVQQEWALRKAFHLAPDNKEITEIYEQFLVKQGRMEQVCELLEEYLQHHPDDAEACNTLGVRYWESGKPAKSVYLFKRAASMPGANPDFLKNLADAYLAIEDFDNAIQTLFKLIQKFPGDVEAYQKLANLYIENGDYKSAADLIAHALEYQPQNEQLREWLELLKTPEIYLAYRLVEQEQFETAHRLLGQSLQEKGAQMPVQSWALLGKKIVEAGKEKEAGEILSMVEEVVGENDRNSLAANNADVPQGG